MKVWIIVLFLIVAKNVMAGYEDEIYSNSEGDPYAVYEAGVSEDGDYISYEDDAAEMYTDNAEEYADEDENFTEDVVDSGEDSCAAVFGEDAIAACQAATRTPDGANADGKPPPVSFADCQDRKPHCREWAQRGECSNSPGWMVINWYDVIHSR